jgi:hypothetical protein
MPHAYFDVSDLNAPYDQVPLQGLAGAALGAGSLGYSGSMGSLSGALGATTGYPWGEVSADTRSVQYEVNKFLSQLGYNAIGTDGKLGPATCGAVKAVIGANVAGASSGFLVGVYPTCQSYTAPTKKGSGGGGGGGGGLPKPDIDTANMYGDKGMSDTMWIVLGTVAAAGAVGAALYFKKKR